VGYERGGGGYWVTWVGLPVYFGVPFIKMAILWVFGVHTVYGGVLKGCYSKWLLFAYIFFTYNIQKKK